MRRVALTVTAALIGASVLIAGCTQRIDVSQPATAGGSDEQVPGFTAFPDMPMPLKGEINVNKTLIFGAGEAWFGRLVINAPHSAGDMFNFYRQGMPGYGWQEIASVRAAVSVLTYSRQERVATLQIAGGSLRGAEVSISVSPRGVPQPPAAPAAPVQTIQ